MDAQNPADPECEVLLEALQMHLETIRSRLVSLTEHFKSQVDIPVLDTPPREPTPTLSPAASSDVPERDSGPGPVSRLPCSPPGLRRSSTREKSSSSSTLSRPDTSSSLPKRKPLSAQLAGWAPLLACYRHVQLEALREHVHQQLQRRRRRDSQWEARLRGREARERRARLALKPTAHRSELRNDTAFLQNIHISVFYKIVEVEQKMKRQGLLRRKVDHELFWRTMLSRDRAGVSPPLPVSSAIEEEPEELTNTWAVTGMQEALPANHEPQTHIQSPEEILRELRRAVEANKPPRLHCLSQCAEAAPPSAKTEATKVSKSALSDVRAARDKMQRMSEHSKRNESTAQLFMERSGFVDFSSVFSQFCSQLEELPLETETDQRNVKPTTRRTPSKRGVSLPPISRPPQEHRRPTAPQVSPAGAPAEERTPCSAPPRADPPLPERGGFLRHCAGPDLQDLSMEEHTRFH